MLLELQNLGKSFGEHEVLKDVNAGVERGDRIGIIGANGTGKTTLLRILCGESLPDAGDAAFGTGVTCGYLEQNARLAPTLDIYATMKLAFAPALDAMQKMDDLQRRLAADPHNTALTEEIAHCTAIVDAMDAYNMDTQIKKVLNGMGFPADTWVKLAGVLSGGEQTRLRLARLLLERPDLLILDEPTNHLDIYMRESLTQALAAYTGTLLLVTHDRYLMQTLGCPILYLEDGKATFYPNFAALQNRDNGKTQEQQKAEDTVKKQAYGKEQRKRRAEVRARIKAVENQIEELGAHIVELENEINDPEVLRDHLLLRDKCDELDDTRFHQQELYDEWEKLAEEQEAFEAEDA